MMNTPTIEVAPSSASTLAGIFSDVAPEEFTRAYLGRMFLLSSGRADRFDHLLTWADLNDLLETRPSIAGSLRLTKDGKDLPPQLYLTDYMRSSQSASNGRLSSKGVHRALKDGATLILNGINSMSAPIRALAEDLERLLDARVQVNLYAAITSDNFGFPCHYDNHDVVVLQLAGQKHWQIYGPRAVTPYPYEPFEIDERPPVEAPTWHGRLTQGDALYLPRGWWHFARPVDEPTMHLSVGIVQPTGRDLLEWLLQRTEGTQVFRSNLPLREHGHAGPAYLASMREALTHSLSQPDLLDTFLRHRAIADSRSHRTVFGLPWAATEAAQPPFLPNGLIHLGTAGRLVAHDDPERDGSFVLYADGRPVLHLRDKARALCNYISDHAPLTIGTLLQRFDGEFSEGSLQNMLRELAVNHLVVIKAS